MLTYIPILSVRPAEVVALAELPDLAKDRLVPLILIKPWLGSGTLTRGIDKIRHALSSRRWFAELDPEYDPPLAAESYAEIQNLRNANNGFSNWIAFVEAVHGAIPVLQLRGAISAAVILEQVDRAADLGRGVGVRIDRTFADRALLSIHPLIDVLSQRPGVNFTIIIDYGQRDARLLVNVIPALQDVAYIRERLPAATISLSSTTFPSAFTGNISQEIFERSFFNVVNSEAGGLVFSDRGSARAMEQGGGGVPRPRIDLPTQSQWNFYRSDCVRDDGETDEEFRARRIEAYGQMADHAIRSVDWDESLNIWGTQLIKITQLRSEFGITSPAKSTACRINIHLTRQSLYGADFSAQELEEEWAD
ncbi:beta family protein [Pararhizobium arenae]|uniref:beta family protein n=1 Tax=Pararhizobium arenae TaxID=1856850 RepID=UPI00094AACC1|nr:hypothetical protein [Pararhizobium arenae]